jgi:hypothetical protein
VVVVVVASLEEVDEKGQAPLDRDVSSGLSKFKMICLFA